MSGNSSQKTTDQILALHNLHKAGGAAAQTKQLRKRALLAKDQYPLAAVRCHLIARQNSVLFEGFSCLLNSVSSSLEAVSNTESTESTVVLIPQLLAARQSIHSEDARHLLSESSTDNMFPVVLVCDTPDAVCRRDLPANVIGVVENNENGVQTVRKLLMQFSMRFNQKIWLSGPFQQNLPALIRVLGFDVQVVDQLSDVECFLQTRESDIVASHVLLASFGKHCNDDLSSLGEVMSAALSGNDLFSMSVVLDEHGIDLKPAWERRGATVINAHLISESQLLNHVSASLQLQHQLAVFQYDAVRQPETGIYNHAYLQDSGRRLHAMASRGNLFFAIVIIKFTASEGSVPLLDDYAMKRLNENLQQHLREDDVIAQQSADEFVCLLTSVGKLMLPAVLHRISHQLSDEFSQLSTEKFELAIGATVESSDSFDAMMRRATMAVLQCSVPGSKGVVIL